MLEKNIHAYQASGAFAQFTFKVLYIFNEYLRHFFSLLTLKASGGGQVLAHVSKPYARDFLVHMCALNAILLKNYK